MFYEKRPNCCFFNKIIGKVFVIYLQIYVLVSDNVLEVKFRAFKVINLKVFRTEIRIKYMKNIITFLCKFINFNYV